MNYDFNVEFKDVFSQKVRVYPRSNLFNLPIETSTYLFVLKGKREGRRGEGEVGGEKTKIEEFSHLFVSSL